MAVSETFKGAMASMGLRHIEKSQERNSLSFKILEKRKKGKEILKKQWETKKVRNE